MNDKRLVGRRTVVTGALAMAATAAAAPARAAAPATPAKPAAMRPLATGDLAAWRAAIGSIFTARTEIGILTLRLAAVHALTSGGIRPAYLGRGNAFEVVFVQLNGRRARGNAVYVLAGAGRDPMPVYFGPSAGSLAAVFN